MKVQYIGLEMKKHWGDEYFTACASNGEAIGVVVTVCIGHCLKQHCIKTLWGNEMHLRVKI